MFNHESSRRGETFVTRKITIALSRIFHGKQKQLYLGNLDSLRDWGHAKDYVKMQWLMLQQDHPEDYVIATGQQISVRDFVKKCCNHIGIEIDFKGEGVDEVGIVSKNNSTSNFIKEGDEIIRVDKQYFRPSEVQSLLGDPSKAKEKLGWIPEISIDELVEEMMDSDIKNEF